MLCLSTQVVLFWFAQYCVRSMSRLRAWLKDKCFFKFSVKNLLKVVKAWKSTLKRAWTWLWKRYMKPEFTIYWIFMIFCLTMIKLLSWSDVRLFPQLKQRREVMCDEVNQTCSFIIIRYVAQCVIFLIKDLYLSSHILFPSCSDRK